MNEVMDALVNRRSVRKYKAEAVPEELVKEIVEGGRDYEVTVEFDKVGVKKMFASFAKLKKI